jgi:putative ABC transport system ATP-binding protein
MTRSNAIVARDVVVDHVTAHGTVRALGPTSLGVDPAGSVAVMGPSGCGKSTLLGLLAGLALPTRGIVTIGDETISALGEHERVRFRRRALGMVYQADNLLPHLTVEENLALQLSICRGSAPADGLGDPRALLARLGLAGLAARLPDQLSGGQRQRVAVARAIIHHPAVILADEPTGLLDAASAQAVIELLVAAQRELGATLVVVTHEPGVAAHMAGIVELGAAGPSREQAAAR